MAAYYNEFDPFAAQWLRNLIAAGHIAPGDVDERSITEVQADDLKGYTQCHFFAGIGGWSYALRLAGWDDNRPVWTGSCPCQDFSNAGPKTAQSGERHLWPYWFRLIRKSRPPVAFGEQVASAIARGWLDDAFCDLEKEAYACAAAVLPALSVGKGHDRPRIWFVAESFGIGSQKPWFSKSGEKEAGYWEADSSLYASENTNRWFIGTDGLRRPVEPEIRMLVDGIPNCMGELKGLGNAIVPEVASQFIQAYRKCVE